MRLIQKDKAYSRIQLSPEEIEVIYYALMTQIANTLVARQRCVGESVAHIALGKQLETELDLSNEFYALKES